MERTVSAKLQHASPWLPTNLDSATSMVPGDSALLMGAPQLPIQKGCVGRTAAAAKPDRCAACQAAKPSQRKTCCARSMERTVSALLQRASPWPPTHLDFATSTVPKGSALLKGAPHLPTQKGCVGRTAAALKWCATGKLAALPLLQPRADALNITRSGCALMKNVPPTHSKLMGSAGSMVGDQS